MFGGSQNYPPFQWLDARGRPQGFTVDLERAIGERAGVQIEQRLGPWEEILAALDAGEIDVVGMFASEERAQRLLFTEPFYYLTHGIYAPVNGDIAATPSELVGHRVAVVRGGYAGNRLRDEHPGVLLVEGRDIEAALMLLVGGEADFALVASHPARRFIGARDLEVDQVSRPLWPRSYVFAVKRDRPELRRWLQLQLSLVQASGRYYSIYEDWEEELEWSDPSFADLVERNAALVAAVATTLVVLLLWSVALKVQVSLRTRDLNEELKRRIRAEEEVRYRAFHDVLTGLPNRDQFLADIERLDSQRGEQPLSVACISLTALEQLVLSFGYSVGEELVRGFAKRVEATGADAVCYLGSGIYGVACIGPIEREDLLPWITAPLELEALNIDPRLAVGCAQAEDQPADEILRRARTALSASKERLLDWQDYEPSIEPDPKAVELLHEFLNRGLDGIVVYLQPQIDIASGNCVGVELLVRWQHPELGLVMPDRFIPLLEQAGTIYQLTQRVVAEGARIAARHRRDQRPLVVSVNVAGADLTQPGFVEMVLSTIERARCLPGDLQLEITESGLVTDPEHARDVLESLRVHGVSCLVDDFGTGYASLSYLSEFPVNGIKLDRLFVGTMLADPRHQAIVRSSIRLAHDLHMQVIAEGVEDEATLDALRGYGCEMAQGYHFARPMPESEFDGEV